MGTLNIDFAAQTPENPIAISNGTDDLFLPATAGAGAQLVDVSGTVVARPVGGISYINPAVYTFQSDQTCLLASANNKADWDYLNPAVFCDADNGYFLYIPLLNYAQISKMVNGVITEVLTISGFSGAASDDMALRATHDSGTTTLRVYQNPTTFDAEGHPTNGLIATATDTSLSAGQIGMRGEVGDSATADIASMYFAGTVVSVTRDVESVDGDQVITAGQSYLIVDNENLFGAAQGTLELGGIAEPGITSWAAGSIAVTDSSDAFPYGFLNLVVKPLAGGDFDPIQIEREAPAGISFLDLVDVSNTKVTGLPALEVGFQLRHSSVTAVNAFPVLMDNTGNFTIDKSLNPTASLIGDSFDCAAFDGSAWGATATQNLFDPLAASSATIDVANVVVTYNRDTALGAGYSNSDFSLTIDGNARTVTSVNVVGNIHTFAYSGAAVVGGQTVLLSHVDPGDGVEAADDGEDLSDIVNLAVTNTVAVNLAPTIVGSAAVTTPENQLNIAQYTIANRDGQPPALSGADAALFDFNFISGDLFQLAWAISPDFETLGAGPHNPQIDIDDGTNSAVALVVAVTLTDIDEISPQPVLSYAGGTITGPVNVTIDTGEASSDFGEPDVNIVNGTASGFVGSGQAYTIQDVTPPADSSGNMTIDIPAGGYQDAAGNLNLVATQLVIPYNTLIDQAPTVVLSVAAGIKNGTFDVIFTGNEPLHNALMSLILVVGGTKNSLSGADGDLTRTLSITPSAASEGSITIDCPAGFCQDSTGNDNLAATQLIVQYDTLAPSVILSTTAGTKTGQFTANVTFSESFGNVAPSNFTIAKGTIDSISGSGANQVANITPDVNDSGNITLQLNANAVGDAAGNPNLASAVLSIPFDTERPDVSISVPSGEQSSPFIATINFLETVTGFAGLEISGDGTLGAMSGSGANYTQQVIPSANTSGSISLNLSAGAAQDAAGNDNTAAIQIAVPINTVVDSPTITGSAAINIDENSAFLSTYLISNLDGQNPTLSGPDSGLFSIIDLGNDSWRLTTAAKDFETPTDSDTNQTYLVTINADDGTNAPVTFDVVVTVLDVDDAIKPAPFDLGGAITNAVVSSTHKARVVVVDAPPSIDFPVVVVNGVYSIDGALETSAPGVVQNGQTIEFWITAAATPYTPIVANLSVGGTESDFIIVTGQAAAVTSGIRFFVKDAVTGQPVVDTTIHVQVLTAQFGGSTLYENISLAIDSSGELIIPLDAGEIGNQVFVSGVLANGKYIDGNATILDLS